MFAPLAMLAMLVGCIKENYEDCEWYTLTFTYEGEGASDMFAQHINDVNLYIYDENDRLVQTQHLDHDDLQAFQGARLNVEHGTYRVVAIGNALSLTTTITLPELQIATEQIAFRSSHIKVSYKVIIKEFATNYATRANDMTYTLKVKNILPLMDFTATTFGDKTTYTPTLVPEGVMGNQEAQFNILRPQEWNELEFELSDGKTGEVLNTLRLEDFLAQYPQIDLNAEKEVHLPIEVHISYRGDICTDVTVTIPEWMIQDVTPEYGTN